MTQKPCPICKRPLQSAYAPFCSRRCADVDLNHWLKGAYAVPARDDDAEADADLDSPFTRPGQSGRGPL